MMKDINDNFFKQMIRENYKDADIYELWNSYVIIENHARKYKKVGWDSDARDSEIEMAVLIELMRTIPYNKKREFYNELLEDYMHIKRTIDNLISFCETLESMDFFKNEILEKK